ncbi:TPR repeat [Nonomuraea wenchangensis]|uniref:TPR repeat n=2 Tax=Nonomuraea wenchangensis TaxID=568860 RepID=A0A1I0LW26_9ACTN|nr:TPR repeat [Nonomuraea wenchangensis]
MTAQLVSLFNRDPRGMQRLAAAAGLAAGTIQHLLSGKTKNPHKETLQRFVQALGQEPGPWLEVQARLEVADREDSKQTSPEPCGPPLGRMIGDLEERDALSLEVHQAFAAAGAAPVLPPYLMRAGFDDRLRAAVAAAERRSRLVMVIGDSSTGKTRACWEAIRAVLPDWRVWHPLAPCRPLALVEALRSNRLAGRSVIWLNEAQDYLQPPQAGESVAAELQALLVEESIGPVLVLGTMWPEYWKILTHRPEQVTDLDPYRAARALLCQAEEIIAPRQFTSRQIADLAKTIAADARLRAAAERAPGGRITQELAGARELLRRYQHADPVEHAVLWAAIDARRLGHDPLLPEPLLRHAAPGYLDEHAWDQVGGLDAFSTAMDRLTAKHRRLPGPLTEHQPRPGEPSSPHPLYRLASYLEQHGRRERALLCPPSAFWEAAIRAGTPTALAALSQAAVNRGRLRHACRLAEKAADAGDPNALVRLRGILAKLREVAGNCEAAERLALQAAEEGDPTVLGQLALMREREGEHKAAEHLALQAAEAGAPTVPLQLGLMRRRASMRETAKPSAFEAAGVGGLAAWRQEARLREAAERFALQAAYASDPDGLRLAAELWEAAGDRERAERLYQQAIDAGDTIASGRLALMRDQAGDRRAAEHLALQAADAGDPTGLEKLVSMRRRAGDREAAEHLARYGLTAEGEIEVPWSL